MMIMHLSQTPVAGACWAAAEAFREAGHKSFAISGHNYSDGRIMPHDHRYPPMKPAVLEKLRNADVIIAHQCHPYKAAWFPKNKPTVGVCHSQPSHIWKPFFNTGWPWAVVAQYQTRLYPGCHAVPNLVPLKHELYQPGDKPERALIAYSPSNRIGTGWDDKGYDATVAALAGVDADVDIIERVPLAECLKRKARAHIVIDECATGSYHRSSLEALALGCVVVNNCDWQCDDNIRRMTGGAGNPFEVVGLDGLEAKLAELVALGPEKLTRMGARNRVWMEAAWNPAELIERNYMPLIRMAQEIAKVTV